jgi:hypothetical protein
LGADDARAESDEEDEEQTKCTASLFSDLSKQLGEWHARVAGGQGVKVLDGEHEGDEVRDTRAEGDRQGDGDGERRVTRWLCGSSQSTFPSNWQCRVNSRWASPQ